MSHSVVELAQLLTGALDENFNIKNKSVVVNVVSWLEAFNITHESYREVQNTRIIKDLQALRQNKANDQVLAKRIKNLLRKWKERLEATVPISRPNSPQNISQGSSDTQFMTQQSQSPPISQQQPQRLVNGPTSFKNLLPKSQNHFHQTVSPPVTAKNAVNSYVHQNGGFDSSTLSSAPMVASNSLLGKRKMPSSLIENISNSNNGGDIDENSNHSRKKLMKMSNAGGIVSSQSLTVNANNNFSSVNNHNNQQITKLHPNSNVPLPHQPQQQQQLQNNLQQNVPQMQPIQQKKIEEQPKKRGRRKGSKGVDSMLNGSIPDFQAEIQQKLALSSGRRNKTTFELQQMLESHQNTQMSWTNGDVLDSVSQDRVNFTPTSISYQPLEPKFTTNDDTKIKKEIKLEPIDELSEKTSTLAAVKVKEPQTAAETLRSLTIEDEIAKLQALLPPIDYEAAARYTGDEFSTYDEHGDVVQCTCTFREVITYEDEVQQQQQQQEQQHLPNSNGHRSDSESKINGDIKNKPDDSDVDDDDEDDDDDDETDDFCAVEDVEASPPPQVRSAVKSIFDPEYDANENLIDEMARRKPRDGQIPKVIEVKIEKDAVKSSRMESIFSVPEPSIQQPPPFERVPIINYVCDEDPMCPARAHFQRDPVTLYDVERLHNSFLEGVNGNWNGVIEEKRIHDYSKDNEGIDYEKHRIWKRVVPRYNFLTLDKVPKSFDDDSPYSIPPEPIKQEEKEEKEEDCKSKVPLNGTKNGGTMFDDDEFSLTIRNDLEFREWHEVMNVRSYNDEVLTILPYVVID